MPMQYLVSARVLAGIALAFVAEILSSVIGAAKEHIGLVELCVHAQTKTWTLSIMSQKLFCHCIVEEAYPALPPAMKQKELVGGATILLRE